MPGWVWMLFGLAVGLSVSVIIYFRDIGPPGTDARKRLTPSAKSRREPKDPAADSGSSNRFTFYDMLPNFEVVIPEEDESVRPDTDSGPVNKPGIYVLQAGSFSSYADADRVKAQLALLGMLSRIQKVSVDDKVYHRVRIGPVESLDRLNAIRRQLRQAEVDVMVIRVGE